MYNYNDFYEIFGDPELMEFLSVLLVVFGVIMLIYALFGLVLYILRSVGLCKLAENRGMSGAGLAWIPYVGMYRIGSIADDIAARDGSRTYFRHLLLTGKIISIVFSLIVSGSMISSIVDSVRSMDFYGYSDDLPGSFLLANSLNSLVSLIGLAVFVITVIALNKIYKNYRPASSTVWTVLSVIFPFLQSIFLFAIRNAVPVPPDMASPWGVPLQGMPPQGGYYPPQNEQWQNPPQGGQPVNPGYPQPPQGYQANPGYPPPPQFQPQQTNPDGYYPPRAPEPPQDSWQSPPEQSREPWQNPPRDNE